MIYDHINNRDRYKYDQKLYQALCYIADHSGEPFPAERKVLGGVVKYLYIQTKPEDQAVFEVHHLLADVHYVVSGVEGFQTADLSAAVPSGPFSEEQDYGEFTAEPDGTYWIKPGYFAVAMPEEVHKTGIMLESPATVQKIVYKF